MSFKALVATAYRLTLTMAADHLSLPFLPSELGALSSRLSIAVAYVFGSATEERLPFIGRVKGERRLKGVR